MYGLSLSLDLYELTMAASYFEHKIESLATFDLFIRRLPQDRSFFVAAGLEECLKFLERLSFSGDDVDFLRKKRIFKNSFLARLKKLKFTGCVYAMAEGTVFFPGEPVMRVTAPIQEAQIVESFLLNTINVATTICSKAARVVLAAGSSGVYDFSLRRTQGYHAGLVAARSAYIAGCRGTSNVLAGKLYGIPLAGTMAHSFIMSFQKERESFRAYASTFPDNAVLLVDTYDCKKGIENAVLVAKELEARGHRLKAIRLDSGNLAKISKFARSVLDSYGLSYVKIFASGNLNEFKIERLLKDRAAIDNFGVGTSMGVSVDVPYSDVIYKLSQVEGPSGQPRPVMKLSRNKITYPGKKQVFRMFGRGGRLLKDTVALDSERLPGEPLLEKVMKSGKIINPYPSLEKIRGFARDNICALGSAYKKLKGSCKYPVVYSPGLRRVVSAVRQEINKQ